MLTATSFVWHWVKGRWKENSRDAWGNDRTDKLADIGAKEAELRPRIPQIPRGSYAHHPHLATVVRRNGNDSHSRRLQLLSQDLGGGDL